MKKELDPNAKRDLSLNKDERLVVEEWLKDRGKLWCPAVMLSFYVWCCETCERMFPEAKGSHRCPCKTLRVRDVVAIARRALKEAL